MRWSGLTKPHKLMKFKLLSELHIIFSIKSGPSTSTVSNRALRLRCCTSSVNISFSVCAFDPNGLQKTTKRQLRVGGTSRPVALIAANHKVKRYLSLQAVGLRVPGLELGKACDGAGGHEPSRVPAAPAGLLAPWVHYSRQADHGWCARYTYGLIQNGVARWSRLTPILFIFSIETSLSSVFLNIQ